MVKQLDFKMDLTEINQKLVLTPQCQPMLQATGTKSIKLVISTLHVNLHITMNLYLTSSNKMNKIVYMDKIEVKPCSGTDNEIN
jgi:hypothetical protein